jgi:Ca2+-transporting ATPase
VNLVLLELILHPTVSLLFVNDPTDRDVMNRPPRSRSESVIRLRDATLPILTGLTLTVAVLGLYLARLWADVPENEARATALIALILGQLVLAFVMRTPERSLIHADYRGNRAVLATTLGTVIILLCVVLIPGLSNLMKLTAPEWWWWVISAPIAAITTLWMEPLKARLAKRSP